MALSRVVGLGGPVGFLLASVGYAVAVTMARTFVSLESHCVQACPVVRVGGFQFHHFYYGLVLVLVGMGFLAVTRRQRVRWDAALIFGLGAGLCADEAGLLLARIPYNDPLSLLLLACVCVALLGGTINAAVRDGTREFKVLDRADILTVLSILLVMAGFLYLDRPLITTVEFVGGASWACAVVLITLFGKKHFRRIWAGQGNSA